MQPRIAIPQPTSRDHAYNRLNWQVYADAIADCGGVAVEVDLASTSAALAEIARTADGILLPGSPCDINPDLYGQAPEPECASADALREQADRILLEQAFATGTPLLAICFGMQMLNVFRGGTLVQDLNVLPTNHAAARGVQAAHAIEIKPGSALAHSFGNPQTQPGGDGPDDPARIMVNSSHHQAVGLPGDGLQIVARACPDNVVEAIELAVAAESRFLLGVQWHPERTFTSSPHSRALFEAFVAAAANYRQRAR